MKNRRGFTLVELMITIGIIVIVAAAGTVGIVISLKRNQEKAANLSAGAQNFESAAYEQLGGMNESLDYLPPVQTKLPDPSESDPSEVSEASEASEASEHKDPEPSEHKDPDPEDDATGGSATYNGPLGHRGDAGNTIQSISDNPDGSTTINLCYNQWNDGAVTIRSNGDGTYQIHGDRNGGNVIGNALASTGVSFDWGPINSNQTFTMNNEQATAWANVYGITLK